jgi:hypothetical protein
LECKIKLTSYRIFIQKYLRVELGVPWHEPELTVVVNGGNK